MSAGKTESPTEPFKRALAHAARSLAEQPDLEVVFSGDGPSLVGNRATLPHPPRDLNSREASRIRGLADQMALRLAHHDATAIRIQQLASLHISYGHAQRYRLRRATNNGQACCTTGICGDSA